MLDSNYLIINRHPQRFSEMRIAGKAAVFTGSDGKVLDFGVLALGSSVYAALYCDEVRNITFVTDKAGVQNVVTILWLTDEDYDHALSSFKDVLKMHFSLRTRNSTGMRKLLRRSSRWV